MRFFLQNVPNEIFKIFKMFENNMKFTRAAFWINMVINNIGYYYGIIIDYGVIRTLTIKKRLLCLLQWKPFKNGEKCFLFQIKNSLCSQDI